jgi:hypothetical protein
MTRFKLFKFLIFFILLILAFQGDAAGKQVLKQDTVSVQKIEVPTSDINNFKQSSSFQYSHASASPGFLERFLLMLSDWIGYRFLVRAAPWLLYSVLVLAFVVLIIVLFRSKFQGVFLSNRDDRGLNITGSEIADHINFDELLNEALKQKNYNLAVRYLYLILLRRLNQKKIIDYSLGKTNFEYINEIKNNDILPQFKTATHNYEYAWYGQFPLDESSYRDIARDYKGLTEKLND